MNLKKPTLRKKEFSKFKDKKRFIKIIVQKKNKIMNDLS